MRTFFAAPVRLDVIGLVALAVALGCRARKLVGVGENNGLARARLHQAVVDRLGHGSRPRVLAFHHVLARGLLKGPHHGLRRRPLQHIGQRVHAVAVDGYDYEVVLLLRLLGDGQAEDLVDVLPRDAELDAAIGAYRAYAAVLLVDQLERELLALGDGEADAGIRPPRLSGAAGEAASCCGAILHAALLELALLGCGFRRGLRRLVQDVRRDVAEEVALRGVLVYGSSVGEGVCCGWSSPMAAWTRLRSS
jgi:hypothetical protein